MKFLHSYWIALVLLCSAVVLALDPWPPAARYDSPPTPAPWATDPAPVRKPSAQPTYQAAGFTYGCNDCHRIIPSPSETDRVLTQHREIQLDHGLNTRCFNCHHRTDRNAFADDFGNPIPWDQPQLLCAKCHGPVYRDWQNGAHGRSNGYWDEREGEQKRLKCIQCHDPHAPPFPALAPAPGPHTLRMGDPKQTDHSGHLGPLQLRSATPASSTHD